MKYLYLSLIVCITLCFFGCKEPEFSSNYTEHKNCGRGFTIKNDSCHCDPPSRIYGMLDCQPLGENDYVAELPQNKFHWKTMIISFGDFVEHNDPSLENARDINFYGDNSMDLVSAEFNAYGDYWKAEEDSFYVDFCQILGFIPRKQNGQVLVARVNGKFVSDSTFNAHFKFYDFDMPETEQLVDSVDLFFHK